MISLDNWSQTLRPYQQATVNDALRHAAKVRGMDYDEPERARRILYMCPTGTGKGTMQLALLRALLTLRASGSDAWIYTPSLEVIRGYLERCGARAEDLDCGSEKLAAMGEAIYVTTPTRARNRIAEGTRLPPDAVIYDEVHHAIEDNDVSGTLFAIAPHAAWFGFTATGFRGTPRGTQQLLETWPEQVEIMSIPEAIQQGWWALPTFEVVGLVDDDSIKVVNGEFQTKAANKLLTSRISDIASLTKRKLSEGSPAPTAITIPSREVGKLLVAELAKLGIDADLISADTPTKRRAKAYAAARAGRSVLVSVRVLSEGVDMPWLRRLIDARPTMSPVSWVQQLGRITRPGERRPEYICVCRNMERHAYLLGGAVPRQALAAAQQEFEKPSKRAQSRSIGLEALNRFKTIPLPLLGGVTGGMNILYSVDGATGAVTEWAVLLDPTSERAVTACRVNSAKDANGRRSYGRWQAADLPPDLTGFATSQFRGRPSQKQQQWWERAAARHGLDPSAQVTQRVFAALPVLSDLKTDLRA